MNIAFIHDKFPAGGAEKVTIDLIRYLSQFPEYKCYVYCVRPNEQMMDEELKSFVEVKQMSKTRNVFIKAFGACKLLKKDKIDIAVQVATQLRFIGTIRKLCGVKVILANHGNTFWHQDKIEKQLRKKPEEFRRRARKYGCSDIQELAYIMAKETFGQWYQNADAYTVLCQAYKSEFERELGIAPSSSHVHVIENAQDAVDKVNYDKMPMLLYCGRLGEEKRVGDLLEIWSMVQDRLPDYRLVLLGDGEQEGELRQMAAELHLERIAFEGHINDPSAYYKEASVVCLTSKREGWPLTLTEAQANGCIPVAYECTAGVSDILDPSTDGICGFKVESGNKSAFAEKLLEIAAMSEEERLTIRKNAVRKRLRYVPEVQYKKWKKLFDGLAGKPEKEN